MAPRLHGWMPLWVFSWLALLLLQAIQPCCEATAAVASAVQDGPPSNGIHARPPAHSNHLRLQSDAMPCCEDGQPVHCGSDTGQVCHPALLPAKIETANDLSKTLPQQASPRLPAVQGHSLRQALQEQPTPAHPPAYLFTLRLRI